MVIVAISLIFCNTTPIEPLIDALCAVESHGGQDQRDGDGGRARGPWQIHRGYWQDGCRCLGVSWPYADARNSSKARQVVIAYLRHYAGPDASWEKMARIHNGGPTGDRKPATLVYWRKVQAVLNTYNRSTYNQTRP